MNLFDIVTISPFYFYKKCVGAKNDNLTFDLRVQRVKAALKDEV